MAEAGESAEAGERVASTLVVIPTYNERDNLEPLLARLHAVEPDVDVLVVDDGSPDGTGELADKLAEDDPRVRVLHRPAKAGLGAAYLAGFAVALDGPELRGSTAPGSRRPATASSTWRTSMSRVWRRSSSSISASGLSFRSA